MDDRRVDDKRSLDELIAALDAMRGRLDMLRKLADALIESHAPPTRLAQEWFRTATAARDAVASAVQEEIDAIDAQVREQRALDEDGTT